MLQLLADALDVPVERPVNIETTALGAALCASIGAGVYPSLDAIRKAAEAEGSNLRVGSRGATSFASSIDEATRKQRMEGWHDAVRRSFPTTTSD